jgi:hypothetical protein
MGDKSVLLCKLKDKPCAADCGFIKSVQGVDFCNAHCRCYYQIKSTILENYSALDEEIEELLEINKQVKQ